jgi:exosome complex RNA-binding protein Csl4
MKSIILTGLLASAVLAKDPAPGWLGYAMGVHPTNPTARITYIEAYWVVPQNPKVDGCFFSPWFGIETSDNLNLIQPVNPWSARSWSIYNEYYQWSPTHNENSASIPVNAGDIVYGRVTFNEAQQVYEMYHSDLKSGKSVSMNVGVQKANNGQYKNYTITYFVMEKDCPCDEYPPNDVVTFYNIKVEWEGQQVNPKFTTSYVDNVCDCRAHILNETSVQITWNSAATEEKDVETFKKLQVNNCGGLHCESGAE